jgi:hypothetical protein
VRIPYFVLACLVLMTAASNAQRVMTAPETFTANAHVKGPVGAAVAVIQIHIQQYSPDHERTAVESALKFGGYPAFLTALRKAQEVGYVTHGDQKYAIRFARELKTATGRTIAVVTDRPIFFVGGGAIDAKPRAGYEVAVIQMTMDAAGLGRGTMAAAARVKPGGETGVQIDDYAVDPVKLEAIMRKIE